MEKETLSEQELQNVSGGLVQNAGTLDSPAARGDRRTLLKEFWSRNGRKAVPYFVWQRVQGQRKLRKAEKNRYGFYLPKDSQADGDGNTQ